MVVALYTAVGFFHFTENDTFFFSFSIRITIFTKSIFRLWNYKVQ